MNPVLKTLLLTLGRAIVFVTALYVGFWIFKIDRPENLAPYILVFAFADIVSSIILPKESE